VKVCPFHEILADGLIYSAHVFDITDASSGDVKRLRHFTHISSPFCLQLFLHYEQVFAAWVDEKFTAG